MYKLLVLILMSGFTFADNCIDEAIIVADQAYKFNLESITILYSADKLQQMNYCNEHINYLDKSLLVKTRQVRGTDMLNFVKR